MFPKKYCIAANCRNNNKNSKCQFFSVPTGQADSERRRKWLTLLGREDLLQRHVKTGCYQVCCAHFDSLSMKKRLDKDSLPTLLLPDQQQHSQQGPSCSESQPIDAQFKETEILSSTSNEGNMSCSAIPSNLQNRKLDAEIKKKEEAPSTSLEEGGKGCRAGLQEEKQKEVTKRKPKTKETETTGCIRDIRPISKSPEPLLPSKKKKLDNVPFKSIKEFSEEFEVEVSSNVPGDPVHQKIQDEDDEYTVTIKEEIPDIEIGPEILYREVVNPTSMEIEIAPFPTVPVLDQSTDSHINSFPVVSVVLDPIQSFANEIAEKIRQMPEHKALLLQRQIRKNVEDELSLNKQ